MHGECGTPTEQFTNNKKVLKFVDDSQTNVSSTLKAASVFSESYAIGASFGRKDPPSD